LVEESEASDLAAAEERARLLQLRFGDKVGVVHGRMKGLEKDAVMDAFQRGTIAVLVATTVIEVGVDVPNATVMLVENAERFGLAQLHQLRGRIGRGSHASYCYLFDESAEENVEARERLAALARTTDGFELADEDLRLRGEGTLFDIKQSGMPDLKLARLAEDVELVKRARSRAFAAIDADPELREHPSLKRELRSGSRNRSTGCSRAESPYEATRVSASSPRHDEQSPRSSSGDTSASSQCQQWVRYHSMPWRLPERTRSFTARRNRHLEHRTLPLTSGWAAAPHCQQ
jgi:superfamily II DNA/RNA helicase